MILLQLAGELTGACLTFVRLCFLSQSAILARLMVAEKQLCFFIERGAKPRRARTDEKILLVLLARFHNWRDPIVIVPPRTFQNWIRQYVLRRWLAICGQKPSGRKPVPLETRALIRKMAVENPNWSSRRISRELLVELGLRVAANTVHRYMPKRPRQGANGDQRWKTFIKHHGRKIIAIDFATVMAPSLTSKLRHWYILVVLEIGSRRILHLGVTEHPIAAWTANQLRHAIPADAGYRFLIHDNDSIFCDEVDDAAASIGSEAIRTPLLSPKANAHCERVIGTMRRECLDWIFPLGENHLRSVLSEWRDHYNCGRPHMALGPGLPEPPEGLPAPLQPDRHRLPDNVRVLSKPILGGLHHEYRLEQAA